MKPAAQQLLIPGLIVLTRNAAGEQVAKVKEIEQWLTVRECCERARCGEDLIYGLIDDGTLTHKWKNHVGPRGTLLIHGASFQMWLDARIKIGRLHPQLAM